MILYGRDTERASIAALLDRARGSQSGVLVLRGAPGIGKSALAADAAARAEGMRKLRAAGVESESRLLFAGLHQLLRPVLDLIDEIPEPQAVALRSALGIGPGEPGDPFLVGAGVLSVLAAMADEQPVLCVVEDAHWLDAPSAAALSFVARRLDAEAVAMVVTARNGDPGEFDTTGLPELRIEGLADGDACALVTERVAVRLAEPVVKRLIDLASGNPLVLLELPLALNDDQRMGRELITDPLPLTERLEHAFRVRAASLPETSQLALVVAAADETGEPAIVREAALLLGSDAGDLELVEQAGLLHLNGRIEFRHPLVRSAVYRAAPAALRHAVHAALAEVLTGAGYADQRAWQLAAATSGLDDDVAAELEQVAARATRRRGHAAAAAALRRAASLTVDGGERAGRHLAAAEAALKAGLHRQASASLEEARALAQAPRVVADIDRLEGIVELASGSLSAAYELLVGAAAVVEELEPECAADILLDALSAAMYEGHLDTQIAVGRRADGLRDRLGPSFELNIAAGLSRVWAGDVERGLPLLKAAMLEAERGSSSRHLLWATVSALHIGDESRARELARRNVSLSRHDGALLVLVSGLSRLGFAELAGGRLASARANATEGLALSRESGLENEASYHQALLAWIEALRGNTNDAEAYAQEALGRARETGRVWQIAISTLALGELALGSGRFDDAVTRFAELSTPGSTAAHAYLSLRATPSLVEAAVRGGRPEAAREATDRFERWVTSTGSRSNVSLLERSHALLARDLAAAAPHFEEALRLHGEVGNPFERARTELLYGESLRRAGLRREAREHLRVALALFAQVGARARAERAEEELRATGETVRTKGPERMGELTPQELQVARFVATGATNREVAAQLFLSPRTVDAHLRSIFRKLGITSRAQISPVHLGDGDPRGEA